MLQKSIIKKLSLIEHTRSERSIRDNFFIQFCIFRTVEDAGPYNLGGHAAFAMGIFAEFNMFSINIPYPVVGSLIITCVTAPTSLPF